MIVKEIMNPKVYKIGEKETILNAFNTMHEKGIKRIFVEDDCGKIIGVMSYRDLVDVLMNKNIYELLNINENIKTIAMKEVLK
jgi:predicted transcriptional regulator